MSELLLLIIMSLTLAKICPDVSGIFDRLGDLTFCLDEYQNSISTSNSKLLLEIIDQFNTT